MVSNCGITNILRVIVHDECPSQLASNNLRGANINVNIFVNIRPILNIVVGPIIGLLLNIHIRICIAILSLSVVFANTVRE